MSLVIDASVAAKWYNVERLSERAAEVKEAYVKGDLQLAAPFHIIYEVGNSIWKNKQLTAQDANEAIASLLRLGMELLEPKTEGTCRAMEIARIKKATFYDALYIQAAEELDTALLTADELQIVASKGITKVIHLKDYYRQ